MDRIERSKQLRKEEDKRWREEYLKRTVAYRRERCVEDIKNFLKDFYSDEFQEILKKRLKEYKEVNIYFNQYMNPYSKTEVWYSISFPKELLKYFEGGELGYIYIDTVKDNSIHIPTLKKKLKKSWLHNGPIYNHELGLDSL